MRIGYYIGVGIIFIHGLIHLMGFVAYFPLGEIAELPYKTTLLGGRWDIGTYGWQRQRACWSRQSA